MFISDESFFLERGGVMALGMKELQSLYEYQTSIEQNKENTPSCFDTASVDDGKMSSRNSTLFDFLSRCPNFTRGASIKGNSHSAVIASKHFTKKISYINKKTYVFKGTIEENISLNRLYSDGLIKSALKIACLDDAYTPASYIDPGKKRFSDSFRIRISIARAVINRTDIFLFDETLTVLDATMEKNILENLKSEFLNALFLVVTHKNRLFDEIDKIFILQSSRFSDRKPFECLNDTDELITLFKS
jgi:ABC-type multidrug transport system fused ATPase/permease subunit